MKVLAQTGVTVVCLWQSVHAAVPVEESLSPAARATADRPTLSVQPISEAAPSVPSQSESSLSGLFYQLQGVAARSSVAQRTVRGAAIPGATAAKVNKINI